MERGGGHNEQIPEGAMSGDEGWEGLGSTWKKEGFEVGAGKLRGESDEGETEVRGWLKATGRARGEQEGDAREKCPEQHLEFRLGRREQGNE